MVNKQFEEIIQRAGFYVRHGQVWDGNKGGLDLENLIELIIEECCDIVFESDPSAKLVHHQPYIDIVNNIRKHFELD